MRVKITKSKLSGCITAPPSKSLAHRYIICAALARGKSYIHNIAMSDDIAATVDCINALGIKTEYCDNTLTVYGGDMLCARKELFCNESATTLRFLVPICLTLGRNITFSGCEKLFLRPLGVYSEICREYGWAFNLKKSSLTVKGNMAGGDFTVPGNVSSQFVSGLLLALAATKNGGRITVTKPIESKPYIDLTVNALQSFGAKIDFNGDNEYTVHSGMLLPAELTVEGDYSNASYYFGANLLGADIDVLGLNENSLQGDRIIKQICGDLGSKSEISVADCPDLAPIISVLLCAKGGGVINDTKRLEYKESNRASDMLCELCKFGARGYVGDNKIVIEKSDLHEPSELLLGHNDHRIVMALSILATVYGGEIDGAESVSKSYPDFFDNLKKAGAKIEIIKK